MSSNDQNSELTSQQKTLLQQFKLSLKDELKTEHDDDFVLRWLRAREWDLKKSEKMLRDSIDWRKRYETDRILSWNVPEVLKKYAPGGYYGVDKNGIPIWYELLGRADPRGLLFSASKKDVVKYRIKLTEMLYREMFPELIKKYGKKIGTTNFIVDLDGISMKHVWKPAVDLYTELLAIVEANYPETLQTAYVINAPSFFPLLYSLVKPFLSPTTRTKIRILGSNWKSVLLNEINPDQIPVHWGGTAKDNDGNIYCQSCICLGGTVPESFYMKNITDNIDMTQFTTAIVNRASAISLEYKVDISGSVLRWNFWTDNNDICYGVYFQADPKIQKMEEMEQVVEPSRVNSHLVPECGYIQCNKVGTYFVHFDNKYSWVNAKKLSYLIEVVEPDTCKDLQIESTNF